MVRQEFTIDSLYQTYEKLFITYQIDKANLEEVYQERGGSINDFAWYIFQKIIMELLKALNQGQIDSKYYFGHCKDVYLEMTFFQRKYEGKKGNHTFQLFLENDLRLHQVQHSEMPLDVIVIAAKDSCDYCKSQNGKISSLEEALKNPLIHASNCKHKVYGCRCLYGYIPK